MLHTELTHRTQSVKTMKKVQLYLLIKVDNLYLLSYFNLLRFFLYFSLTAEHPTNLKAQIQSPCGGQIRFLVPIY